ncbi:hypothetical protein ACIPSE_03725 [Streptomyces sp. NPDC090106]|uniref:hypothetical protein n=1 Tax=Streptomyces sp. NPDC090106 TaxID=3365946 RepID=UPI003806BA1D
MTTPTPGTPAPSPSTSPASTGQPGVTQPAVVQPPGISGYLPPDVLLPIVLAVLVVYAASRPGAAHALRALIELLKGSGGPPAP